MPIRTLPEVKSADRAAFDHYLRTGKRLSREELLYRREAKFNPYHDELGRFTSPPGVTISHGNRPRGSPALSGSGVRLDKPPGSTNADRNPIGINRSRRSAFDAVVERQSRGRVVREAIVLPPKSLDARARAVTSGNSELVEMPDLHVVLFGPGVKLRPVPVATFQEFDAAAKLATNLHDLDAVITGPQFELMAGSDGLVGQAMIGGRVYGKSAPDRYYFGTMTGRGGVDRLTFAKGDPIRTQVDIGFRSRR